MTEQPTLEVPPGYDDLSHEVKAAVLARNSMADLRSAVDGTIGHTTDTNPSTVTKDWMVAVLLALGGPDVAPADVEVPGE